MRLRSASPPLLNTAILMMPLANCVGASQQNVRTYPQRRSSHTASRQTLSTLRVPPPISP
jgi:hypothetical protein